MTIEIDLQDESYQLFLQESLEYLQNIEIGLLNLRREFTQNQIHALMRAAHSIKGSSSLFGLSGIEHLSHNLENVFKALYSLETEVDVELEELLLQAYDCLRSPLLEQINTHQCNPTESLEKAAIIFSKIEEKLGHSLDEEMAMPEIELAASNSLILSQLVESQLPAFQEAIAAVGSPDYREKIIEQATEFALIGENFGLPLLETISTATIAAVTANPEATETIAQLALADFFRLQQDLLQDKQDLIGYPSQKLLSYSPEASNGKLAIESELETEKELEKSNEKLETELEITLNPETNSKEIEPESEKSHRRIRSESNKAIVSQSSSDSQSQSFAVRVDVKKLDRLNSLVGDILTQDSSLLLQNQQNQKTTERLTRWTREFYQLAKNIQESPDLLIDLATITPGIKKALARSMPEKSDVELHNFTQNLTKKITEAVIEKASKKVLEETTRLEEIVQDIASLNQQSKQILRKRQQTLKQLQNNLMQLRMLPIERLLKRFPRMVRDLAIKYDKQVQLQLTGTNTLVDKAMLEPLHDPLVHLVRNAFDHGIETPENRKKRGKSPQGTIEIRTYHTGNHIYIEIEDDGQGINLDRVRAKIVAKGLVSTSKVAELSDREVYEYLFKSGFSTKNKVSEISGRGVGLDTVKLQVEALKGSIQINSNPGMGTTFTLRLPFSLSVIQLLVFEVNNSYFAITVDSLVATVNAEKKAIITRSDGEYYQWYDREITIVSNLKLSGHYSFNNSLFDRSSNNRKTPEDSTLLIVADNTKAMAIKIDRILMQQDLTIKPFDEAIAPPPYLLGCTILGDGRLVPVLDIPILFDRILEEQQKQQDIEPVSTEDLDRTNSTILIVDDSITIRRNLSIVLRKAGYQVLQAGDGQEALLQLQQYRDIKAIISDIDMPKMNGIEFLSNYKKQFPNRSLPIIMLTTRNSEKFRKLAKRLGANAYLTKPYLKVELLNILQACLQDAKQEMLVRR